MKIIDSKLWDIGSKIYDLIIINLLWMIFSMPLITLGPATYAGLNCIKELEKGHNNNIFVSYINYFKENFMLYTLVFNTILGIMIVFTKLLLVNIFEKGNLIIISIVIFILLECILMTGYIFIIKERNPIDLIIKSIIYGNRNVFKVILNFVLCICIVFIAIYIPILMPVVMSLCMFISYKILYIG